MIPLRPCVCFKIWYSFGKKQREWRRVRKRERGRRRRARKRHRGRWGKGEGERKGVTDPHNMNSFGETFQEIFYGKLVKTLLQYYWNVSKIFSVRFHETWQKHFRNFSINVKSWPSKNISWNNTASFCKAFIKSSLQRLWKETCKISWNIMERCWKYFSKRCFYSDRTIQENFLKPCKNISRKVIRKPFKKISCIIAWNITKRFEKDF